MKTKTVYIQDVEATARKALIAANPDYFSWDQEEQERFRATGGWHDSEKVRNLIWQRLFGKPYTENDDDELSSYQNSLVNCANLLMRGIGQDYLYLNEFFPEGKSLLDFVTLYDYDYDDYLFQEKSKKKSDSNYQGVEYYPFHFPPWIRLIIDNQFYYGSCFSCARYIVDEIEEVGRQLIEVLIPYDYVDGKNHGDSTTEGMIWDMQLEANGQERQLEELRSRWYQYTHERWFALSESYVSQPPAVYVHEVEDDEDSYRLFIFNNQTALQQTRWRHFLEDVAVLEQDFSLLNDTIIDESAKAKTFLQTQYDDIMKNFDPTVVKLKKKRKIIIAPGALDKL